MGLTRTSQGGIAKPDFAADVETQLNQYTIADVALLAAGYASVAVGGTGDYTLGSVLESDKRTLALNLTGVLTGNRNILVPATESGRLFVVKNSTTGAFTLTIKVSGGTGVIIGQGSTALLWHDGVNVYEAGASNSRPHASVTHNANQSIANNALTALSFNTETFDAFGMHDTVTNNSRLVLNKAGLWMIGGSITWATNGTGIRAMAVRMNGTTRYAQDGPGATAAGNISHAHSIIVRVTGTSEYAELCAYQNSGVALDVELQSAFSPRFWAVWQAD